MFGIILISVATCMHIYVFWRAVSVPVIERAVSGKLLIITGLILWALLFFGWVIGHRGTGALAGALEFLGMSWMGILFLTFISLLVIDLITCFGMLMPRLSPSLRGWALFVGLARSGIAFIQGTRPPVVEKYEVSLPGLPGDLDGTVLVAPSDLHLGSQLGEEWLADRIVQVEACQPDIIVLLGDILEGHGASEDRFIGILNQLSAPLGVWVVEGNHEVYRGDSMEAFEKADFTVLRNEWTDITPGLVLAGVEDLGVRRRNSRSKRGDPISQALDARPPGATIFLSHTPAQVERAAAAVVGLMLSGHTHGGQIWPFDYLVRSRYPFLEGAYEVDGMTLIVSRGTGTWGPRMRLWHTGQILHVTLRAKS